MELNIGLIKMELDDLKIKELIKDDLGLRNILINLILSLIINIIDLDDFKIILRIK